MSTDELIFHHIITKILPEAEGDGWEFCCLECSYHSRYVAATEPNEQKFELLNIGNPHARHMSNHRHEELLDDWGLPVDNNYYAEFDGGHAPTDDTWLTPELRRQIDEILRRIDTGD